jgi:chitodextrinase
MIFMQIIDDNGATRPAEQWEVDAINAARYAREKHEEEQGIFVQWDDERVKNEIFTSVLTALDIPAEKAVHMRNYYPAWSDATEYKVGDRVNYMDTLWRCLQDHTSQSTWMPSEAPSLWAKVLINDIDPEAGLPEWEQPDSTNTYNQGDRVTHNGKTWVSTVANNSWEPGVYGWDEVTE